MKVLIRFVLLGGLLAGSVALAAAPAPPPAPDGGARALEHRRCVPRETEVTVHAYRGRLVGPLTLTGELVARRRIAIHAPELANVRELEITEISGPLQAVHSGQPLVAFERGPFTARLRHSGDCLALLRAQQLRDEKTAAVERLSLALEVQRREFELERARRSVVKGVGLVPELQLERAKLDRRAAELELNLAREALHTYDRRSGAERGVLQRRVETAEAEVELDRQTLERLVVTASRDGVVEVERAPSAGERRCLVAGDSVRPGDRLLQVIDPAALAVEACLPPEAASSFRLGDKLELRLVAGGGKRVTGKVAGLEGDCAGEPGLRLVVEPQGADGRWLPGLGVLVTCEVVLAEEALLLPASAVVRRGARVLVRLVREGVSSWREVELGRSTPDLVEIRLGLVEGDPVALVPWGGEP